MWWNALIAPVASLFGKALDVVDKYVPDKDLAEKLKSELNGKILEIANGEFLALIKAQSEIIIAEAKGESWLQRNWRPVLMSIFGAIVANNYIIGPYVGLLFGHQYATVLDVPPDMWDLLKLGLGGYIVGRSAEKIAGGDGLKSVAAKILKGS